MIFPNLLSLISSGGSTVSGGLPLSAEGGLTLHFTRLRDHLETDTEQVWINIIHLNQLSG